MDDVIGVLTLVLLIVIFRQVPPAGPGAPPEPPGPELPPRKRRKALPTRRRR
jgi:hypothetical protein